MTRKILQCVSISALAFGMLTSPVHAEDLSASSVFSAVNYERSIANISPLTMNDTLNQAAQKKAEAIVKDKIFAHNLPRQPFYSFVDATGYSYDVLGENLAIDHADTESTINAWMHSPLHKKNIMDGRYTETGIAVIPVNLDGSKTILVVQLFAKPKISILPVFTAPWHGKKLQIAMNSTAATVGGSLVGLSLIMGLTMHEFAKKRQPALTK